MHPAPTQCPVCGEELRVTRLACGGCGTTIEGEFTLSSWSRLNPQQLAFAELFVKCRGKIKDLEEELGISYPTVVARLNELVAAMGFGGPRPEPEPVAGEARSAERQAVLDQLANGDITAAEAAEKLRGLR